MVSHNRKWSVLTGSFQSWKQEQEVAPVEISVDGRQAPGVDGEGDGSSTWASFTSRWAAAADL